MALCDALCVNDFMWVSRSARRRQRLRRTAILSSQRSSEYLRQIVIPHSPKGYIAASFTMDPDAQCFIPLAAEQTSVVLHYLQPASFSSVTDVPCRRSLRDTLSAEALTTPLTSAVVDVETTLSDANVEPQYLAARFQSRLCQGRLGDRV